LVSRGTMQLDVLLISNYFPPEIGSAAHLYYTLAKHLVKRGHEVTVLTGVPRYNVDTRVYDEYLSRMGRAEYLLEELDGIRVIRTKLPLVERKKLFRRGIEHFEIAYRMWNVYKLLMSLKPLMFPLYTRLLFLFSGRQERYVREAERLSY